MRRKRHRGFTIVELMVVTLIIALLAMIVIPRLLALVRRAKEADLLANLKVLRNAVEQFRSDCAAYPPSPSDLLVASGARISASTDSAGRLVKREEYHGPYLRTPDGRLPVDPFTRATDWNYDSASGQVHSSCTDRGLDATPYSSW